MEKDKTNIHVKPEEGGGRLYLKENLLNRMGIQTTTEVDVTARKGEIKLQLPSKQKLLSKINEVTK